MSSESSLANLASRILGLLLVLLGLNAPEIRAQDTNLSVFVSLAAECLAPLLDGTDSFIFEGESGISSIETGLINSWMTSGKEVARLGENALPGDRPLLSYQIQHTAVTYDTEKKRSLIRNVELRLSAMKIENNVVTNSIVDCPGQFSDTIDRRDISEIEDSLIPETKGHVPPRGFLKRYAQPIVVGAASAITVYLFFSVRSDEAGS